MKQIVIEEEITKKKAIEYIKEIIYRFQYLIYYFNENKERLQVHTKLLRIVEELEIQRFSLLVNSYFVNNNIEILSSEGCRDFLLKLKELNGKFNLNVFFPKNLNVVSDDIIEKFITKLTSRAFDAINANIALLPEVEKNLKEQANKIDITKPLGELSEIELCILKQKQYREGVLSRPDLYQRQNGLLENGYTKEYNDIQAKLDAIEKLPKDYPLIRFLSGSTDSTTVKGEIEKAVKTVSDAQNKIKELIEEGKFPVWELEELVEAEKATFTDPKEIAEIDAWLKKQKTNKKIKDILMTLVPIGLSLIVFFIPGGASLLLLGIKAGAQILNAGLGAVSAYQDFQDAKTELLRSNADVILSDAQIDLLQSQGKDAAVLQFFLVFISAIGTAADIADSARMLKLYNKADNIGAAARARLRKCERMGEKQLKECSEKSLRFIGTIKEENAVFIYNMGNDFIEAIGKSGKKVLADNLSSLAVEEIPKALDFFPNNLNTNVIWLGMDFDGKAGDVLTSSKKAIEQYNKTITSVDLMIHITDTEQTVVDKANKLFKSTTSLTEAERVALLREMNIGNKNIKSSNVFIRLNQNFYPDLTYNKKEFAWVTDPYVLMGKGEMKELMEGIGYSYEDAKNAKKLYMDVIIFDKPENVQKLIEPQIIDWDKIKDITFDKLSKEYDSLLKVGDLDDIKEFQKIYPNLVSNNKVDKELLEQNYIKFYREKMPGVKLENETRFENMTDFFNNQIGANQFFTGSGVTVSDKAGIGSTEFAFINNDCKFNVEQINKKYPGTCHIVRLETDDTGMFILKK